MTIRRNKLSPQTNGAAATPANSAASGDPWAANNLGTGSTAKYRTTAPLPTGASAVLDLTPATSQIANIDDTALGSVTDIQFEDCFYYPAAPTVNNTVIAQIRGSGGRSIDLAVTTAGKVVAIAAAQIGSTPATALTAGNYYRYRWKAHGDAATPANGTTSYTIFDMSGNVVQSSSGTGTINNAPFTTARRGCTSGTFAVAGNWTTWTYGLLQLGDVTADIGPYPTNVPPTANAGPDQVNVEPYTTVVLFGAASSDPDGTIASYAWAQTAGPAVTLTGAATATCTFTAPATMAGTSITLQLTVTDNLGATSPPDTVTVTVLPHTLWTLATGGAAVAPLRVSAL